MHIEYIKVDCLSIVQSQETFYRGFKGFPLVSPFPKKVIETAIDK
jgi:hypothetical protein